MNTRSKVTVAAFALNTVAFAVTPKSAPAPLRHTETIIFFAGVFLLGWLAWAGRKGLARHLDAKADAKIARVSGIQPLGRDGEPEPYFRGRDKDGQS